MKTKLLCIGAFLLSLFQTFGQTVGTRKTLPYYEGFSYDADSKLLTEGSIAGQGGWQTFNANAAAVAGSNPIIVSDPGWNMGGLPIPTFNALRYWSSGDDPVLNFTIQSEPEFAIYSSFIFRVPTPVTPEVDLWTDTIGEYIYSFGKTSSTNGVNYTSNVYLKKTVAAATSFNIGIAETNTTVVNQLIWASGTYNYDSDIRIVIKYQIDATNPTGLSTLWINPVTNSTTEPASDATTALDLTTTARTSLDKIRIMKSAQAKTPYIILDEIRVANRWNQVSGPGAVLAVAKNEISGLTIYPNPVSNGKVFINSENSTSKKVQVYDILGKQLIQKDAANGSLDVSSLSKGIYLMRVSEGSRSSIRKLIVE